MVSKELGNQIEIIFMTIVNNKKLVLLLLFFICFISGFSATKQTKIYIFGVATSFKDSTLYITEIQEISNAYIDSKTRFLVERDNYSYQLRDYLKAIGEQTPTVSTIFATEKKDIEKKYLVIKKKYLDPGLYQIKQIDNTSFIFKPITPTTIE